VWDCVHGHCSLFSAESPLTSCLLQNIFVCCNQKKKAFPFTWDVLILYVDFVFHCVADAYSNSPELTSHQTKRHIWITERFLQVVKYCTLFNNYSTRSDCIQLLHFCMQLYIFRVLTPIISSSYSCNYSFWHWSTGSDTICSRCWVGTGSCVTYGKQNIKRKPYGTKAVIWYNKLCGQKTANLQVYQHPNKW